MLPMRISVSVTPAARAGCTTAGNHANNDNNAARKAGSSLIFLVVCIDTALNAKLTGACAATQRPR
jgi:hypothetical protein